MLTTDVLTALDASVLCWLATAAADGTPNVSPKELFCHAGSDEIVIAQIASPQSEKNVRANGRACLSFVDVFTQKGYQLNGRVRMLDKSDPDFATKTVRLREMAGAAFPFRKAFLFTVETVRPILAPRYRLYPDTTEEDQVNSALVTYGVTRTAGDFLESTRKQFAYYRQLGDKAMAQLPDADLFREPAPGSNSIALIVKHLHGNMLSRWTDFLTADGEKEWRNRDDEFTDTLTTRSELNEKWDAGWATLFTALTAAETEPLDRLVYIRNMGHTLTEAVNRQLAHYAYHVGQIVYLARLFRGEEWRSLSIPKGGSAAYNAEKFAREKRRAHFTGEFLAGEEGKP